jgi:uncharacterized membrane protein HdeD (DUF308 family)
MTEQAKAMFQRGLPWRRGAAWWLVGVEGLILTLIGIYVLVAPDSARDNVRALFGWFLLVNNGLIAFAGLRAANLPNLVSPYRMLSAGVGLTTGLIIVLEPVSDFLDADAAKYILAIGLLSIGLIGLVAAVITRFTTGSFREGLPVGSLIYFALGAVFLYNVRHDALNPRWFGAAALIGGGLAIAFAYTLYRNTQTPIEPAIAAAPADIDVPAPVNATPSAFGDAAPVDLEEPTVAPVATEPGQQLTESDNSSSHPI